MHIKCRGSLFIVLDENFVGIFDIQTALLAKWNVENIRHIKLLRSTSFDLRFKSHWKVFEIGQFYQKIWWFDRKIIPIISINMNGSKTKVDWFLLNTNSNGRVMRKLQLDHKQMLEDFRESRTSMIREEMFQKVNKLCTRLSRKKILQELKK